MRRKGEKREDGSKLPVPGLPGGVQSGGLSCSVELLHSF